MMPFGANSRMRPRRRRRSDGSRSRPGPRARAGDQLRDPGAEVEDEDLVVLHGRSGSMRAIGRRRAGDRCGAEGDEGRMAPRTASTKAPPASRRQIERRADAPVAPRQVGHQASRPAPMTGAKTCHRAVERGHRTSACPAMRVGGIETSALDRRLRRSRRRAMPMTTKTIQACVAARTRGRQTVDDSRPMRPLRRRALQRHPDQPALHQHRHHADDEQRPAVLRRPPAEGGVETQWCSG